MTGIAHLAIGVDGTAGNLVSADEATAAGLSLNRDTVMTATGTLR